MINLDQLMEEAKQDLTYDMSNAEHFSLKIPSLQEKYARLLVFSKASLRKEEMQLATITAELHEYYREDHPGVIDRRDIEIYVKGNSKYTDQQKKLELVKLRVEYLEKIMKALDGASFAVNNAVKMHIWRNGNT